MEAFSAGDIHVGAGSSAAKTPIWLGFEGLPKFNCVWILRLFGWPPRVEAETCLRWLSSSFKSSPWWLNLGKRAGIGWTGPERTFWLLSSMSIGPQFTAGRCRKQDVGLDPGHNSTLSFWMSPPSISTGPRCSTARFGKRRHAFGTLSLSIISVGPRWDPPPLASDFGKQLKVGPGLEWDMAIGILQAQLWYRRKFTWAKHRRIPGIHTSISWGTTELDQ